MLAGNIPGKTGTISQKIAMVIQDGDYATAGVWVAIVMLIAFLVIFSMNFNGYRYVIGSETADVRPYSKILKEQFDGRGGGKPVMVQGSVNGSEEAIRKVFE